MTISNHWLSSVVLVAVTGAAGSWPAITHAQTSGQARSAAIEEIVVTARRREESIQTVPVAVTAFSREELYLQSVEAVEDLDKLTPGFTVQRSGATGSSEAILSIRGQTQEELLGNGDPAVGIYVDGVYLARTPGSMLQLVDIERIEVLKGPQGTLFGRNTTGGALNIISRKPDLGGYNGFADVVVGNYGKNDYSGAINIPFGERAAGRFVFSSANRDGFGESNFTGQEWADDDELFARGSLLWQPSDKVELVLRGDWGKVRESAAIVKLFATDPTKPGNLVVRFTGLGDSLADYLGGSIYKDDSAPFNTPVQDPIDEYTDRTEGWSEVDIWGVSGEGTVDFDNGMSAKLIAAYRSVEDRANADLDGTPAPVLSSVQTSDQDQLSLEVQLTGAAMEDRLSWIVGGYYFTEDADENSSTYAFDPFPNPNPFGTPAFNENRSIAGFVQADYSITDKLRATAGFRYTSDRKKIDASKYEGLDKDCALDPASVDFDPQECIARFNDTFNAPTYTLGLDYQLTDGADSSVMLYVVHRRGFRSGGQNLRAVFTADNTFDEEIVKDVELGMKGTWLDGRLRVNAAGYYQKYTDIQKNSIVQIPSGLATKVDNAAEARIWGGELELWAIPVDDFTLGVTASFTDPKFQDFTDAAGNDRSDEEFQRTPRWTYSLSGTYSVPTDLGIFKLRADWSWKDDEHFGDFDDPATTQPSMGLLNARLGLEMANGLEISAWAKNLTDKEYFVYALDLRPSQGQSTISPGPPRTYGVQLTWRFGE